MLRPYRQSNPIDFLSAPIFIVINQPIIMRQFISLMLCVITVSACSKKNSEPVWQSLTEKEKSAQDSTSIRALRDGLYQFYKTFPDSAHAAEALLKSARIDESMGNVREAINQYAEIDLRYPESTESATALFLTGFAYNNQLSDTTRARAALEKFLKKNPNHPLAQAAQFELQTLGMTLDRILINQDTVTVKSESQKSRSLKK
jgi:tetratricopeptide (TPR) repeat protein